jgi:hypothetical protein
LAEFTDLSPCTYFPVAEPNTLVSVGWLGPSLSFQTGSAPNDFFDRLTTLIADPWRPPFAAAGGHSCELCQPGVQSVSKFSGREFSSHSVQNIFVPHGGRVFVAPEGIAHYIACHRAADRATARSNRPLVASGIGTWALRTATGGGPAAERLVR